MKRFPFFVLVICLVALGVPVKGGAQKVSEKPKLTRLTEAVLAALRLQGGAQKERLAALSNEYADLEVALIREFDKANSVEQKSAVVFLMGRYRLAVCVRHLAENLTLKYESTEDNHKKPLWGMYPAVEALTRIGKPAIWHMLRNIETGKSDEFRRLSTEVIRKIEGTEVACFILGLEIKKAKDEKGRARLEGALEYLEKVKG